MVILALPPRADHVPQTRLVPQPVGPLRPARLRELRLLPPAEVEGPEHGNVDTQPSKHELNGAEHKGHEGCAGQVPDEVDDEDLPEADDADDDAAVPD